MKRRAFLSFTGKVGATAALGLTSWRALAQTAATIAPLAAPAASPELLARAAAWHAQCLTLDTHVDAPLVMLRPGFDLGRRYDPAADLSQVDLPRMREGGADAAFFAVYMAQGARTAAGHAESKAKAHQLFDVIHTGVGRHPEAALLATEPDDLLRAAQKETRAIFIGMENAWPLGTDLSLVETYYQRGARYITLCHMLNNEVCDASTDTEKPNEHGGLSPFGEQVVREMNRLGMMVDVSHTSDATFDDCLRLSRAPIIASHSSCRTLCNHPRNLTDDQLRALRDCGGVAHMTMFNAYVAPVIEAPERTAAMAELRTRFGGRELSPAEQIERREAMKTINRDFPVKLNTLAQFADHIDHAVKIAGIDHVGIGTDFDGGGAVVGCLDASQLPAITAELIQRGYTQADLQKIWGGNTLRVWRDIKKAAA